MSLPMPPSPTASDEKAAIVLFSLGPERAEALFRRLDSRQQHAFARALHRLPAITPDQAEAVLDEFAGLVRNERGPRGGANETRAFLGRLLEPDRVEQIMDDLEGPLGRDVWERLSRAPEQALAACLEGEQPQTVAVILSRLSADKAAKLLIAMPDERAKDVVVRLAGLGRIDPAVLDDLKAALQANLIERLRVERRRRKPETVLGSMFDLLPSDRAEPLMAALAAVEPDTAERIQKAMFVFADIPARLNGAALQAVIRACDRDRLLLALKLAQQDQGHVVDLFFQNMSKRAAEQMQEELASLSGVSVKAAQQAQAELIVLIQDLAKSGEIALQSATDEAVLA
ncbi:flagellar motor switch protein FliG [Marinivivus vitaminiproducens]|uniref:flagellar motor switch protein FliG n=1 Tax=Marinivivus vitaminiproducens TaxID=3035935 RepID=UPI0027A990AE|nr:FliG C-terminal domain-containing protein [Geminicoccaceae bacterium SCSIO 64248]